MKLKELKESLKSDKFEVGQHVNFKHQDDSITKGHMVLRAGVIQKHNIHSDGKRTWHTYDITSRNGNKYHHQISPEQIRKVGEEF